MLPVWARLSGGPWCGLVTASLYSTAADAVRPAYWTGRARSRGAYFTSLPARSRVGIRPSHGYWSLSSLYVALVWDCEWLKRIIHTCLSLCRFSYCHKFCQKLNCGPLKKILTIIHIRKTKNTFSCPFSVYLSNKHWKSPKYLLCCAPAQTPTWKRL